MKGRLAVLLAVVLCSPVFSTARSHDGQAFLTIGNAPADAEPVWGELGIYRVAGARGYHAAMFDLEVDGAIRATGLPNDPLLAEQRNFEATRLPVLWARTGWNSSNLVVVLDSGIDIAHPEFANLNLVAWRDFVQSEPHPIDENGHGTAVMSVLAAGIDDGLGIAGTAAGPVAVGRVLDRDASGRISNLIAGLRWANELHPAIISLSLGTESYSAALHLAVAEVVRSGTLVVAAAGNSGSNTVLYPAAFAEAIAVGSVNSSGARSAFSPTSDRVDILAPGEEIVVAQPDGAYKVVSGTSFSTPLIAGALSLGEQFYPSGAAGREILPSITRVDPCRECWAPRADFPRLSTWSPAMTSVRHAIAAASPIGVCGVAQGDTITWIGECGALTLGPECMRLLRISSGNAVARTVQTLVTSPQYRRAYMAIGFDHSLAIGTSAETRLAWQGPEVEEVNVSAACP